MPKVQIPESLACYAFEEKNFRVDFDNTQSFVFSLKEKLPNLYNVLFNSNGELYGFVMIYKNNNLIDLTKNNFFSEDDIVDIVVPLSGG